MLFCSQFNHLLMVNDGIARKLDLFETIVNICTANMDAVDSIPAFKADYEDFLDMIIEIDDTIQLIGLSGTGLALNKKNAKVNLSLKLSLVCGSLMSYAAKNNNSVLHSQVTYTYSDLYRLRATSLQQTATAIYTIVQAHAADLLSYGWTAEKLAAINTLIQQFEEITPKPRAKITTVKAYHRQLKKQVKTTNNFLADVLDKAALMFKEINPTFYMIYEDAGRNYQTGIRHRNNQRIVPLPATETEMAVPTVRQSIPVTVENAVNGEMAMNGAH